MLASTLPVIGSAGLPFWSYRPSLNMGELFLAGKIAPLLFSQIDVVLNLTEYLEQRPRLTFYELGLADGIEDLDTTKRLSFRSSFAR